MAEYSLEQINRRASDGAAEFIAECEEHYHRQIHHAADIIAENSRTKPVVLLNGPSSSGKTTTNERLGKILETKGIHAEMISMDDYYRTVGTYDLPQDEENGVPDLESPCCMDLNLLSRHLSGLARGQEILLPRFDFETRASVPASRALRLDEGEVVLIEGIHAFNPEITGALSRVSTCVYLSVASEVVSSDGLRLERHMLRFLRRAMRDSLFRNSPIDSTLRQWNSVRRGEKLYIQPYCAQAEVQIDTFLPYELCALMAPLAERLRTRSEALRQAGLESVTQAIDRVSSIDYAPYMPVDSVLHEFVG